MNKDTIRVACVGAGYFSQFHYGSWARIAGVELVGAADLDRFAAQATGLPAFDNARQMIEETKPDLLDIIVPPSGHAETIRMALAKGLKYIVCQKPFCQSLAEAREIATEAEMAGATVVVHENFRFMPWYRAIKAQIAAGAIGDVHQATFRLRPGDGQGPDAYLDRQPYFQQMPEFLVHETAVHWIDTFRFLFGTPLAVYADLLRRNSVIAGEDAGYILFDHPNQIRALFDGNRHLDHASDNPRRTMGEALFEGTKGALSLFGDGRVEQRAFGATDPKVVFPPNKWDGFGGDCVHLLQTHVVDTMRNGNMPENTARQYCDVIRIQDAIYQSARSGQKVFLEEIA